MSSVNPNEISSSLEDYLEIIAALIAENKHAHAKEIADRMQVKMPSVTNALQALSNRGLIKYQTHAPVTLTSYGAERAAVIRHRHQAMKFFFQSILKLDERESDRAACKIEHVLGEKEISRFVALADAINSKAEAAVLRSYLDSVMPKICNEPTEVLVSLDSLQDGEDCVVVHVSENLRGIKKFADLGLVGGTFVHMENRAPIGDLIRIRVLGSSLSMRSGDAAHIWLRKTNVEDK